MRWVVSRFHKKIDLGCRRLDSVSSRTDQRIRNVQSKTTRNTKETQFKTVGRNEEHTHTKGNLASKRSRPRSVLVSPSLSLSLSLSRIYIYIYRHPPTNGDHPTRLVYQVVELLGAQEHEVSSFIATIPLSLEEPQPPYTDKDTRR